LAKDIDYVKNPPFELPDTEKVLLPGDAMKFCEEWAGEMTVSLLMF
jgi:hypothetical protein